MGATPERIPMVRCRLDGPEADSPSAIRYIPLSEFGLWQYLMETRHGRWVAIEEVSFWVSEPAAFWHSYAVDELEPVLRLSFEQPGPGGVSVPIERYFPAETYPRAQEALLAHYQNGSRPQHIGATAGYFVPALAETVRGEARSA